MAIDVQRLSRKVTAQAFKLAKSALKDVTMQLHPAQGTFNTTTGERETTGAASITVKGLFYKDRKFQGPEEQAKNGTILLQQSDVEGAGYTGKITDVDNVVMDGITWDVEDVVVDPGDATYQLMVRRG